MTEKFETVLFGYSKRSVCEYLSNVSEEISKKHIGEIERLNAKIKKLEEENERLSGILEEERRRMDDETTKVSQIIVDARSFADELKEKATEENRAEMDENSKRNAEVAEKIKKCSEDVDDIRRYFQKILTNADEEIAQIKEKLEQVNLDLEK